MKFCVSAPQIMVHQKNVTFLAYGRMFVYHDALLEKLSSLSSTNKFPVTSTPKATTVPLLVRCILRERKENAKYKVKSTVNPSGTIIAWY